MKKRILQKLAQKIDELPSGKKRKEAFKDWLDLKLSKEHSLVTLLKNKYMF